MDSDATAGRPTTDPIAGPPDDARFGWHPQYQGQTVGEARSLLAKELASDQKSYALAMDAPDDRESEVLVRVVGLEKRWGPYAMDWANVDPGDLAGRVVAHEWERDQRRELFPYREVRDRDRPTRPAVASAAGGVGDGADDRPWWAFWRR